MWLCGTCHRWAHKNPFDARGRGLIVSRYSDSPGSVPVETHYGTILLNCNGTFDLPPLVDKEDEE